LVEERELISRFVYVVDDDRDVRRSLSFMLGASDIRSYPFGSGEDFLEALPTLQPGCVLLDLRMPQMDGFDVMRELAQRELDWPVIVMTGHGEVPVAVRAMKLGAVDFIEKPFSEDALLACFATAFALLDEREASGRRRREARERISQLTARERDILEGLLAGEAKKQLAARLGISLRTVEMHRGNMMDRLGCASLAEALALAIEAGLQPAAPVDG
jgi:two-component system, LuxR family, response regulator FixJ